MLAIAYLLREGGRLFGHATAGTTAMLEEYRRGPARIAFESVDQRGDQRFRHRRYESAFDVCAEHARVGPIAGSLHLDVVHGFDRVADRCADLSQRRQHTVRIFRRPAVANIQLRDTRRAARRQHDNGIEIQIVRRRRRVVRVHREQVACFLDRERQLARDDLALHRMQFELEVR